MTTRAKTRQRRRARKVQRRLESKAARSAELIQVVADMHDVIVRQRAVLRTVPDSCRCAWQERIPVWRAYQRLPSDEREAIEAP